MSTNQINENGATFFLVHTTNTSEANGAEVQISANVRETKESKVTDAMRYRNIWIPEFSLPSVEDKFRPLLLSKLYELAKSRFEQDMEESGRLATKVPASSYTIPALLDYFSAVATSNRLTKESIEAWFKDSATRAYIVSKKDEATATKYGAQYAKFASPNHGVNPPTCIALLATLQTPDIEGDKASAVAQSIATRLQTTIDKANASQVEAL